MHCVPLRGSYLEAHNQYGVLLLLFRLLLWSIISIRSTILDKRLETNL